MTGLFNFKKRCSLGKNKKLWSMLIIAVFLFGPYNTCVSEPNSYNDGYGEAVELISPVIWSIEDGADHVLKNVQPAVYESSESIECRGTVTSIAANWEFDGEVTLQVSADDGVNYTSVTNGVPVSEGFGPGSRIKWKAVLAGDSRLTRVKITYTDDSGVLFAFGTPELSGFKFRKSIKIDNPGGIELFNYQIRVRVGESENSPYSDINCGGKSVSGLDDIRFTAKDGETLLPFFLEDISGNAPDRTGFFWVKVPNIPAEGTEIYMYYSKPAAENLSDPEKVFDMYDDFSLPYIDDEKWIVQADLGGSYDVEDSLLKLISARIISKEFELDNGVFEYKARTDVTNGKELRGIIRYNEDPNQTQIAYSSVYDGAEHAIAVGNIVKENVKKPIIPGIFYYYRIIADNDKITFERSRDNFLSTEVTASYEDNGGLIKGFIGVETGGTGDNGNVSYFDWVRVRKLAKTPPVPGRTGRQETMDLPVFNNAGLSAKGDIVAATDENGLSLSAGEYSVTLLRAPYEINTVIPYIEENGEGIETDISLDGGVSWIDGCSNGVIYNSSEHFDAGRDMILKIKVPAVSGFSVPSVEDIRVMYSMGPVVSSRNIHISGASGAKGMFIRGDTIKVEWDNSPAGDNNADISAVYCNFSAFGGNVAMGMLDKGPGVDIADKKKGDDIYSTSYTLPDDMENIGSIYVTAENSTGSTTRDGHVLTVNTMENIALMSSGEDVTSAEEEEETPSERTETVQIPGAGKRPGTELYDLVIKVGNNTSSDPEEDDRASFKHGDVVIITPAGHEWSETEKNSFLILQMYLTPEEKKELLRPETRFTGRLDAAGNWITKTVKKREKKIDLDKFGLSRERLSEKGNVKDKISRVKEIIKGKDIDAEKVMK